MTAVLTKKIITEAERNILEKTDENFRYVLLVSIINGTEVLALFSSMEYAHRYLLRTSINFCIDCYLDMINDDDVDASQIPTFEAYVTEHMNKYYEFFPINHLNVNEPIYVLQNYNYHVYGKPSDYLTNSIDTFNKAQGGRNSFTDKTFGMNNHRFSSEWIKKCTLKIDPLLPEIDWQN